MVYTTEQIEGIGAGLRELPELDKKKRQHNKKEAIRLLAKDIAALRRRGYTLEQIAESLRGLGLDITERTLRNYLQQHKRPAPKKASVKKAPAAQTTAAGGDEPGELDLAKHDFKGRI